MEQSYTQASLRNTGNPSLWMDTHLLEMMIESIYRFKGWSSAKSKPRCSSSEPKDLDYPQKFLLRVVAHLGNLNPSFFLASPNLRDEIPFKGGSL
jgi:hypothetical protein